MKYEKFKQNVSFLGIFVLIPNKMNRFDDQKKSEQWTDKIYMRKLHKIIVFFFTIMHSRIGGQKAYCDGHMDRVVFYNYLGFLLTNINYFTQDFS